jgi:Flp pilus assembly protein TadD
LEVKLNPTSWNAFDSLGEAYARNGQKAEAISAYRQSLVLNPKNENGRTQLTRLNAKAN